MSELKPNQYGEQVTEDCLAGRHDACSGSNAACECICRDQEAMGA